MKSLVVFVGLFFATSSHVFAGVVINPDNGHAYDLISSGASWQSARSAAEAITPPPGFQQGHLVTYSDASEEEFVLSAFGNALNAKWIGFTDQAREGEWRWIDGTPGIWQDPDNFANPIQTAHTNWRPTTGEPNQEGNEDFAVYSLFMAPSPQWNDLSNSNGAFNGYVVEFSPLPEVTVELAPASICVVPGEVLTFDFSIINQTSNVQVFEVWLDGFLPNGNPLIRNPIAGPITLTYAPMQQVQRSADFLVPILAPAGRYRIKASAGGFPDVPIDCSSVEVIVQTSCP